MSKVFGSVDNTLEFEQARADALRAQQTAPLSPSRRTRWLTFANERGGLVMAPGVRTHQLTLLFGMGLDWYKRAMRLPDEPVVLADSRLTGTGLAVLP